MVCENCKERQATITITQLKNGHKSEQNYCEFCASKFHPFHFDLKEEPVSLQQFITNWFGSPQYINKTNQQKQTQTIQCQTCELTYKQFLKQGKVGCANCYEAFREQLPSILEKIQAGTSHVLEDESEAIETNDVQEQVQQLREQQKIAIEQERFEDAAKIRDTIKELQRKNSSGGDKLHEH